jgi:hypothetical protein
MPKSTTGNIFKRRGCVAMKKLLVIWFVIVFVVACEMPKQKSGVKELNINV